MIYPPGYLEAQEEKMKEEGATPGKRKRKGKSQDDSQDEEAEDFIDDDEDDEEGEEEDADTPAKAKKSKTVYKISKEWQDMMEEDKESKNLWDQVTSQEV